MPRDVHEVQVLLADELDLGSFIQAVVFFAHETSVLDGFLGDLMHVGLGTDYSDIIRLADMRLLCQGYMLAN